MDLSCLPTDNLYKFLALSGVAIVLYVSYLNVRYREGLWARIDAVRRNQARFNAEHEALTAENAHLDSLLEAAKGGSVEEAREIIAKRAILRGRLDKLDALKKTNDVDVAAVLRIEGQLRWMHRLTLAAVAIGLAMAGSGFALWYYKVQLYQDQEIRLKAMQPANTTPGAGQR